MKKPLLFIAILLNLTLFVTACNQNLNDLPNDDIIADGETDKEPDADDKEDEKEEEKHTHTFTEWSYATLPSCQSEGVMSRDCECGEAEIYTTAPLRHNMVEDRCADCGREYSQGLVFRNSGIGICDLIGIGECEDTEIIIPPISPDGDKVNAIYSSAFSGNESITRIDIPATVTTINSGALSKCSKLIAITVDPENKRYYSNDGNLYTALINYLIQYAIGKTNSEFVIPEGTVSIESSAFTGANNLVSITLPDSFTYFSGHEFNECAKIKNIFVNENNTTFSSLDGVLYSKDGKTLIRYCTGRDAEEFIVPDHVEAIGFCAFSGCNFLKKVTLNDEIKDLKEQIFYLCQSLSEVNIPEGIVEIPDHAFASCPSLKSITIPDSVEVIGQYAFSGCSALEEISLNKVKVVKNSAFALCYAISNIDFGSCLTELGDYSFTVCNGISSIALPDGLTLIGSSVFYGCENLESVILPESIELIKLFAFSAPKMSKIFYKGNQEQWNSVTKHYIYENDSVVYYYSEETPTVEGDFWRYYENNPMSWAYDEPWLDNEFIFESNDDGSCTLVGVTKINRPEVIIPSVSPDGKIVTVIGEKALYKQNLIESLIIPDSVVTIEGSAIGYLSNLKYLTIGNGVKTIDSFAFYNLGTITSIVVPDSVTTIGSYAFSGCDQLTSIVFGSGITSIPEYALYGNLHLTSVSISAGVVNIEKDAFSYCSRLTDIYFGGTAEEWAQITIAEGNDRLANATVHTN